jgi:hypothetical protein
MRATNPTSERRIVPLDSGVFEVHLDTAQGRVRIGKVSKRDDQRSWAWEHRDGERSSPVAVSIADAVDALTHYHRSFKTQAVTWRARPDASRE